MPCLSRLEFLTARRASLGDSTPLEAITPTPGTGVILVVVVPVASRPTAVVSRVMPFPFTPMSLFPLPMFPITVPVIVPVAIPARISDNNTRRLGIHRRGRGVDRLWGGKRPLGGQSFLHNCTCERRGRETPMPTPRHKA